MAIKSRATERGVVEEKGEAGEAHGERGQDKNNKKGAEVGRREKNCHAAELTHSARVFLVMLST